jgi:hypothetical protein
MPPDFRAFEVLSRHGVPFVIIGGHAVSYHGYPRMTDDADLMWLRSPDADARLLAALEELDAKYIGKDIDPATRMERMYRVDRIHLAITHMLMLWTRFGFLDLFDYVPGEPLRAPQEAYDTAEVWENLRFVSLPWLRRLKRTAGRPKDLLDLAELEKIHGPPAD